MTGPMEGERGRRAAGWLLAIAVLLVAYGGVVWWTGGFNLRLGAVRLRSHEWIRPLVAAAAAAAAAIWIDRRFVAAALARAWDWLQRPAAGRALAGVAAAWALVAGCAFGTFSNGGSDSYGYVGQAQLLAEGKLTDRVPISPDFTWPEAEVTLRPLAFTQGRAPGEIAPIYPPGLSLLMAPLTLIDERALYLLVPAFGVLLIWGTERLGAALGAPLAGGCAALLLSLSPTFLFQLVQPMSDVPAAACWLWALLLAFRRTTGSAAAAGALAGLAILIRPNLAPLAAAIALPLIWPLDRAALRRAILFVIAIVPGVVILGWIQAVRYGSPLASGYGQLSDAFAWSNIVPNVARYPAWLTSTHTPFIWLGVLAPFWFVRRPNIRVRAIAATLLALGTWLAYLPYVYFKPDEWFYTRFLLPAIPIMLVFAAAILVLAMTRVPHALRVVTLTVVIVTVALAMASAARTHGAFEMRAQEQKYRRAGLFVRETLPPNAFLLAMQHSGSIRYYAARPTLRWDLLDAASLDDTLAILRGKGYEPYLVVDVGEDPIFRQKFEDAGQKAARKLTPLAVLGDARVYAFDH